MSPRREASPTSQATSQALSSSRRRRGRRRLFALAGVCIVIATTAAMTMPGSAQRRDTFCRDTT